MPARTALGMHFIVRWAYRSVSDSSTKFDTVAYDICEHQPFAIMNYHFLEAQKIQYQQHPILTDTLEVELTLDPLLTLISRAARIAMISFRTGSCTTRATSSSVHLSLPSKQATKQSQFSQSTFHNPQNVPHIHHQERARRRCSPLLLRFCSAHGRGCYRIRFFQGDRLCWRVSTLHTVQLYTTKNLEANRITVTLSPSARRPPKSSTSARRRRPSTSELASPMNLLTPRT